MGLAHKSNLNYTAFFQLLEFLEQLASSPHTHSVASDTQEKEEIKEEVGRSAEDEKEYTANEEEAVKRCDRGDQRKEGWGEGGVASFPGV